MNWQVIFKFAQLLDWLLVGSPHIFQAGQRCHYVLLGPTQGPRLTFSDKGMFVVLRPDFLQLIDTPKLIMNRDRNCKIRILIASCFILGFSSTKFQNVALVFEPSLG